MSNENEKAKGLKDNEVGQSEVDGLVRAACEFCNDTGKKVDHVVEGAPAAVMVFCDCPAGDAVRETYDEIKSAK